MPDKFGLLAEDVMGDVQRVIITIGAGKNDNAEFHALTLDLDREVSRIYILAYQSKAVVHRDCGERSLDVPDLESSAAFQARPVALSSRTRSRR